MRRFGLSAAALEAVQVLDAGSAATVGVAEPRAARQAAVSVGERVPRPDRLQVLLPLDPGFGSAWRR